MDAITTGSPFHPRDGPTTYKITNKITTITTRQQWRTDYRKTR